ncbi:mechanosensitive ion channel family protein [Marinobacterium jannaschii]|uniref:mechanosensitive ion channel family protein n=1 Tax=Marinobacterium jannaschii TaxID=64970 RepID=UPI000685B014|nr:mechanosensitive ion channel family protein [Marinobacterium jannaschii]
MDTFWPQVSEWLFGERAFAVLRALLLVLAGFVLAKFVSSSALRLFGRQMSQHHLILLKRLLFYTTLGLFLVSALRELGFKLSVLLGAAGILTVAVGFASQTSASNIISGLFLLGERPFSVGDVVKIDNTMGEVLSIDLLSVKLKTYDNLFVRIPNETLIKSEVTTLTRFPIRRFDLQIGVAYKEDIPHVNEVLLQVADSNPLCLEEPAPAIIIQGFGESSINIQLSVWAARSNFLALKNSIYIDTKAAFDQAGIEIPYPHRTIYAGSQSDPIAVRVTRGASPEQEADLS